MVDSSSCFFLSYAHSPPLEVTPKLDPDRWVGKLFTDLSRAVEQHPSWQSRLGAGFYDRQIPAGSDWKESISQALSATQVFVPLYSREYVERSWPGREWVRFRGRMERAGIAKPERRFVPVLWTPLFGPRPPGFREALALGADQPGYAENGLQALMRFGPYESSYRAVLNELADRIVTVAQESPLEPSHVPDIDMMESEFLTKAPLAVFSVEVAAPVAGTPSASRDHVAYGDSGTKWSPFPRQRLSLAEYVKQIAERLDFEVDVSELGEASDDENRGPGIILIDPWYIVGGAGQSLLEAEARRVPQWVLPLVVIGPSQDAQTDDLAQKVLGILGPTTPCARTLEEVDTVVPKLIAEAERRYLRHGGGTPLPAQQTVLRRRQGTRPSLRGPVQPAIPKTESGSPGEAAGG